MLTCPQVRSLGEGEKQRQCELKENIHTRSLLWSPWVFLVAVELEGKADRKTASGGKEIYHSWTGVAEAEVE